MQNWILTDNDCGQYVRKISENEYEIIQVEGGIEDDDYEVKQGVVDLRDYYEENGEDTEMLLSILNAYGYKNTDAVRDTYGESYKQIIAECIFETHEINSSDVLVRGGFNGCLDFIEKYVKG